MRAAMMLMLLACIPPPAVRATPCSGAGQMMLSIGKELSAGNLSGAEQMLVEMDRMHAECPQAILAHARIAAANGAAVEAEDFFLRDVGGVPNQAQGYLDHSWSLMGRGESSR